MCNVECAPQVCAGVGVSGAQCSSLAGAVRETEAGSPGLLPDSGQTSATRLGAVGRRSSPRPPATPAVAGGEGEFSPLPADAAPGTCAHSGVPFTPLVCCRPRAA